MVDQDHVEAALKKLGKKDESTGMWKSSGKEATGAFASDVPSLMFEQESWDNVLKKLGSFGGQAS